MNNGQFNYNNEMNSIIRYTNYTLFQQQNTQES